MGKKKQRTRTVAAADAANDARSDELLEREVIKLLDARQRLPRSVYKLAGGGVGMDTITHPSVDTTAMSAAAVISTPAPDRDGDIMLPRGVRLENYRKNPVVLWEHGLGGIHTPIAKSEDAAGRLALRVGDEQIEATAYFTNSVRESEQIFALIAERIVRAASIRADVTKSRIDVRDGEKYFIAEVWELIEWSWGGLGVNPDAVAKLISTNRLAGSPICESLLKSLRPYAPVAPAAAPGWSASGDDSVEIETTNEGSTNQAAAAGDAETTSRVAPPDAGDGAAAAAEVANRRETNPEGTEGEVRVAQRLTSLEKTLGALRRRFEEITPHGRHHAALTAGELESVEKS